MRSYMLIISLLFLLALSTAPDGVAHAQDGVKAEQADSDVSMLEQAEADIRFVETHEVITPKVSDAARRAEQTLKSILEFYPQTNLREQVEEKLYRMQELLGQLNLSIARFYLKDGALKGVEKRLLQVVREYTKFSRMDEVLLLLGRVYVEWEQPQDAAGYLLRLLCDYPSSVHLSDAYQLLNRIGVNALVNCEALDPK